MEKSIRIFYDNIPKSGFTLLKVWDLHPFTLALAVYHFCPAAVLTYSIDGLLLVCRFASRLSYTTESLYFIYNYVGSVENEACFCIGLTLFLYLVVVILG